MIFHDYIKRPGGQSLVWSFSMYMYGLFGQCFHRASQREGAQNSALWVPISVKHRCWLQASGSVFSVSARMISFAYGRVSIQWQKVCHSSSL